MFMNEVVCAFVCGHLGERQGARSLRFPDGPRRAISAFLPSTLAASRLAVAAIYILLRVLFRLRKVVPGPPALSFAMLRAGLLNLAVGADRKSILLLCSPRLIW